MIPDISAVLRTEPASHKSYVQKWWVTLALYCAHIIFDSVGNEYANNVGIWWWLKDDFLHFS